MEEPVTRPRAMAGGVEVEIQYAHYVMSTRSFDGDVPIGDEPGELEILTGVDVAAVMTWTESGPLSMRVERTPSEPDMPAGQWEEVIESTVLAMGPLFLYAADGSPPVSGDTGREMTRPRLTVRRGVFGIRISARGRALVENDPVAEGEEHLLQLWRIADAPARE